MKLPQPRQLAEYREVTFADKTPAIGFVRFRCKRCNNYRPTGGSKKNTPYGWICEQCKNELITGETK